MAVLAEDIWPLWAVTSSNAEIETARQYLVNVDAAWRAAEDTDTPFYIMCALLEKESMGKNIYGHDVGGYFSAPGEHPVTQSNFAEFYQAVVVDGHRSNGVGPMQITYRGYFPQMREQGLKAWVPYDNMVFGIRIFMGYYRAQRAKGKSEREAIRAAGCQYNTGSSEPCGYGDRLLELADKWKARLS